MLRRQVSQTGTECCRSRGGRTLPTSSVSAAVKELTVLTLPMVTVWFVCIELVGKKSSVMIGKKICNSL